jgi:hypothetical protein
MRDRAVVSQSQWSSAVMQTLTESGVMQRGRRPMFSFADSLFAHDPQDPHGSGGVSERPPAAPARTAASVAAAVRILLTAGDLEIPFPGGGDTAGRWASLSTWACRDLTLARLAEGHTDAVAILAEAERPVDPGALYGVWAARSGGTGARLRSGADGLSLHGTIRFCSGARELDRALIVADSAESPEETVLVEAAVRDRRVVVHPDTWRSAAMDAADTQDVTFECVPVSGDGVIGKPGWYTIRPGFALGGAGVAALWWGGAAGILNRVAGHLPSKPDAHQLAHLGHLHATLEASGALLDRTAASIDRFPCVDHSVAVATVRSAVEHGVREILDRAPRMVGPTALSRDPELASALSDLMIYVRQHHGERDHAALGEEVLAARENR